MPLKTKSKVVKDLYIAYADNFLKENPDCWSTYKEHTKHYVIYRKVGTKITEVINYPRFRKIVETWCSKATDYIIEGEKVSFGYELGYLAARVVERNFSNRVVDWGRTKKRRIELGQPDNKKILIYYTDQDWCRVGWVKSYRTRNIALYKFVPAGKTIKGDSFIQRFSKAIQTRPTLKQRYEQFKYNDYDL